jgi:prepilin peptidase CpaA
MFDALVIVALPLLAIYAGCTDFLAKIIPNRVPLLAVLLYFVAALGVGAPLGVVGSGVAAALIVFACGLVPFALGVMGAGDVKLASALALWFGLGQLLNFLLLVSLSGLAMVVVMVAFRREISAIQAPRIAFFAEFASGLPIPYGIAIAAAALQLHPTSPLMRLIG